MFLVPPDACRFGSFPHPAIELLRDRVALLAEHLRQLSAVRVPEHVRENFFHSIEFEPFDLFEDLVEGFAGCNVRRQIVLIFKRLQRFLEELNVETAAVPAQPRC